MIQNWEVSPLVSVIMPARNAERSLPETLRSLVLQTHKNWELCVTDDGSSDLTASVISDWAEGISQAVSVKQAAGVGPSTARNLAAQQARGSLLAFLDADDIWHPEKLTQQIKALQDNSDLVGVTCDYAIVEGSTKQVRKRICFDWSNKSFLRWIVLEGNGPALCSTLLLRSDAFTRIGGFDPHLWNMEDVDLALRLGAPVTLGNVPQTLCDYILQPNQNHQQMETVNTAVSVLRTKEPFSVDHRLARRLRINLRFLEAARRLKRTRSPRHLGDLARLGTYAPFIVTRTAVRTITR